MSQQRDPLQALWQSQPTSTIDLDTLIRRLGRQRRLQRFYIALDFIGSFIACVMFWYYWDSLTPMAIGMAAIATLIGVGYGLYITYLRRHAAWANLANTQDYQVILLKQLKSNQRIARITLHCCWHSAVMLVVFASIIIARDSDPIDKLDRSWPLLLLGIVCLGIWGRVAQRREQKFKREAATLEESNMSDLLS